MGRCFLLRSREELLEVMAEETAWQLVHITSESYRGVKARKRANKRKDS